MTQEVKLVVDGTEYEMPVLESTLGRPVLDITAVNKAGFGLMTQALWRPHLLSPL